jgi:hypothetical protein
MNCLFFNLPVWEEHNCQNHLISLSNGCLCSEQLDGYVLAMFIFSSSFSAIIFAAATDITICSRLVWQYRPMNSLAFPYVQAKHGPASLFATYIPNFTSEILQLRRKNCPIRNSMHSLVLWSNG